MLAARTDEKLRHQVSRFIATRLADNFFSRDTAARARNVLENFAEFLGNPTLQSVTKADLERF